MMADQRIVASGYAGVQFGLADISRRYRYSSTIYIRVLRRDVAWCVRLRVCLFGTPVSHAKTDEPIEMPFASETQVFIQGTMC